MVLPVGTCPGRRCPTQGGRAQPHIPASAAPVSCRIWRGPAPQNSVYWLAHFLWRCVMALDPEAVSRQNLGSLQSCLVEGDP